MVIKYLHTKNLRMQQKILLRRKSIISVGNNALRLQPRKSKKKNILHIRAETGEIENRDH